MKIEIITDALGCFWNAANGAARERQSLNAIELADVLTAGVAAVAARLEEHAEGETRRITELLEANNRYQQDGRDARDALRAILDTSGARPDKGYHAIEYTAAVKAAEALLERRPSEPGGKLLSAIVTLEAITDQASALRQGGPAPEDLQALADALETATDLAASALAEIAPERKPA